MCVCKKCTSMCGVLLLALGVVFLLRDVGIWDFWNIQGWTALFLLVGVAALGSSKCPDCQAMKGAVMSKKK
ncbi:hypothetical protein J4458_04040 [Candidatus Woesearchaeota archaeon]|nr:hypothetical protein [Candidatus Woesearchaeota archaeon]